MQKQKRTKSTAFMSSAPSREHTDRTMWIDWKSIEGKKIGVRLNSCTCHIFLCKIVQFLFSWSVVVLLLFVAVLVLNDISFDMHGSSSMACCTHKCMSILLDSIIGNIYRQTAHVIQYFSSLYLSCRCCHCHRHRHRMLWWKWIHSHHDSNYL